MAAICRGRAARRHRQLYADEAGSDFPADDRQSQRGRLAGGVFRGIPWSAVNFGFINGNSAVPTNSLQGKIGTLMSNNVLTSQITPELTSKLSYRYYDFDNETPQIIFPAWVSYDQTGSAPKKQFQACRSATSSRMPAPS